MQLTSVSPLPTRPSLLLKFPNATILLDAALNFDTLNSFLPRALVKNQTSMLNHAVVPREPNLRGLKKLGGELYIDAVLELQHMWTTDVDLKDIDVVLISNWISLLALPCITEDSTFAGVVYCTEATKELGALAMEELVAYFDGEQGCGYGAADKSAAFWKILSKAKEPEKWKPVYNKQTLDRALAKVSIVSFGGTKTVNGLLKCTAFSSGHSIGSCNWIVEYDVHKIGYVCNSTSRGSHARPAHWTQFRGISSLILTSLSRFPSPDPAYNCQRLSHTLVETLKRGGNVLLPTNAVGHLFDLIEVVFSALETGKISRDVPVYFISPVAASVLAFVNIFPEYLSEQKAQRVYNADEPFVFSDLVRDNRIKVYDSISGAFSKDFKSPCVMLTGHPSLRCGNVVHFLELWGRDKKNAIIMTDPDFSLSEVYKPYRSLAIPAYEFPLDTRLDFSYINNLFLSDMSPSNLIVPEIYCRGKPDQTIEYVSCDVGMQRDLLKKNTTTFKYGVPKTISSTTNRKRVLVMPDIMSGLRMDIKKSKANVSLCSFNGYLATYDYDFALFDDQKAATSSQSKRRPRYFGALSAESLIEALRSDGIPAEHGVSNVGECVVVNIPSMDANVKISSGGTKSLISCSDPTRRRRIQKVIYRCLEEL